MNITHISIKNVLGIEELEFSPEGFNSIEGPNGVGKTSVLEAIKSVVRTGHDATLLRQGAEKGEVVFVLDDGQSITKRISTTGTTTEVRDAEGKKLARPAEAIKALTDLLSVNPVEFLTAPKKDRVRVLLESMPLNMDLAELSKASGIKVTAQPGIHALSVIESVTKQVYDDRTGTNRAVKEKEGTINQIRLAMPDAPDGVEGSEDDLLAKIEAATAARDVTLGKISKKLTGIKDKAMEDIAAIRQTLQAAIDDLKAKAQAEVDAINTDVATNTQKASEAENNARTKHQDETTPIRSALDVIKANRGAAAKREQAQETIKTLESELETLRQDADSQTKALEDIDAYKMRLLSDLPIPGLEVKDGEILRDGLPFDRLNTAQQVDIAVKIAKLRAGKLGVVCVDGLELLDSAKFDAFRESSLESGLQLFVTRVGNNDFEINTHN